VARLIPSFTDEHTPHGEREVFAMLSQGDDDWVALHSLDLAPWNRSLRTEIDFLVIVPDTGILCIEVKSNDRITFENDHWSPPEIKRSPFKQAVDGRYAFYRRLRDLAPQFRDVPVVHVVIFPNSEFEISPNLSVKTWELIDRRRFRWFNDGTDFCQDLRRRMVFAVEADPSLRGLTSKLRTDQIETIIRFCVPVQRRRSTAREEINRREEEIQRLLRDQQRPVLQLAKVNRRLIVFGGAGTGKTLIATEVARRVADVGDRVAFLCFNQMIGDRIVRQVQESGTAPPNLIVGRAIRVLADLCGLSIPDAPDAAYWDDELPALVVDRLTDPDFEVEACFDVLVIDEAQDLLARPHLWECLQRFLVGGVAQGRFYLFGDFENQVLKDRGEMSRAVAMVEETGKPAHWRLAENCRNYRIVGQMALRLSGTVASVYDGYARPGGGVSNYDIYFYPSDAQQIDMLGKWLVDFRNQGYRPSEITVLSFHSPDNCAASRLAARGIKLRPARFAADATGYTSVHAYKGMENKVIILTDVVIGEEDFQRVLFYTGLTRATESVRVLCDSRSEPTLMAWVMGRASNA
jgi:hypothetical protein